MAKAVEQAGRLLREPLVQFAVLAGLLFFFLSGSETSETLVAENQIVISSAEVDRMAMAWVKTWQRPPSGDELDGLIREAIREQVLYREALALGLDRDDVVIRRHLRQKYEFVTQDLAYDTNPDEGTLRAFYAAQPERYARSAQLTFSHILFSPDRRGEAAAADAVQALVDLESASDPQAADLLGDATSLPPGFTAVSGHEVEAMFGPGFATALLEIEPGRWAGPVASSYGLHLVWLSDKVPGDVAAFEEVRQRVRDDWVYDQRVSANEAVFQQLLARYEVVVEPAPVSPAVVEGGS